MIYKNILKKIKGIPKGNYKKVLIINPPQIPEEDFDINIARTKNYPCFPPYGPGVLCKSLESRGYITEISDLNYDILYSANNDTNFNYKCWKNSLEKTLQEFDPDLIGISCMYSMTHKSLREVAKFTRELYKDKPIIAGGVHVSSAPKEVLKDCKEIDSILLYESELSLPIFLEVLNEKEDVNILKQIAVMVNDKFEIIYERATPSEKEIDISPEYHELNIRDYSQYGRIGAESRLILPEGTRISTVLSNRGCRGSCTFCSVRGFNGKGVRQRSIDSIVNEIEGLKKNYGIEHVMWLDDDLFYNKDRALTLFNEITKRNLGMTWDASNGLVASAIDKNIIEAASKSGCIYLNLGIESGSPEILKATRKPSGIKHFLKSAEVLSEYPEIFSRGFLMLGFPNETIGQIKQTIDLARKMSLDWYSLQPLIPLPSTALAGEMIQKGELDEEKFIDGTTRCFIGITGGQRVKEKKEKLISNFENLLNKEDNYCPSSNELKDLWFLADYYTNYDRIPQENNPIKLVIKEKTLKDISEKKTSENPLSNLFLSIVEEKLGNIAESEKRMKLTKRYLENSAFWRTRFETLDLYKLIK
jgi:radical SAM superfamily enzyme YgiQ (UPF0313 family)